jgi:hypothetical protein
VLSNDKRQISNDKWKIPSIDPNIHYSKKLRARKNITSRIPPTAVGGSLKSSLPTGAGWTLIIPQLPLGGFGKAFVADVGWTLIIPQLPLGGLPKRELKFLRALSFRSIKEL